MARMPDGFEAGDHPIGARGDGGGIDDSGGVAFAVLGGLVVNAVPLIDGLALLSEIGAWGFLVVGR